MGHLHSGCWANLLSTIDCSSFPSILGFHNILSQVVQPTDLSTRLSLLTFEIYEVQASLSAAL